MLSGNPRSHLVAQIWAPTPSPRGDGPVVTAATSGSMRACTSTTSLRMLNPSWVVAVQRPRVFFLVMGEKCAYQRHEEVQSGEALAVERFVDRRQSSLAGRTALDLLQRQIAVLDPQNAQVGGEVGEASPEVVARTADSAIGVCHQWCGRS